MPNTPTKTLDLFAEELKGIADHLMENRSYLNMGDLNNAKLRLGSLRISISVQLSIKQQGNFNANMEEVEDLIDSLIRRIEFDDHTGPNFTKDVRNLHKFLYAAASLLSLTAILFSLHPQP